jgi:hypothetical protein
MKKKILLLCTAIIAIVFVISCNNDDDNKTANPVIGTWKLTALYTDGKSTTLTNCEMEETYIFGPEQYTHETYENGAKRSLLTKGTDGGDDDDDGGDDKEDDKGDDHSDEGEDDIITPGTDDNSDDTDDNPGTGGNCINAERIVGYWTVKKDVLTLTANGVEQNYPIVFEEGSTRFYIEIPVTVKGQTVVKRYVFQRQ